MAGTLGIIKEVLKRNNTLYLTIAYLKHFKALLKRLISDKRYISSRYKKAFGRDLDLAHPKTINEKIQWLKLYDRRDIYTTLADKYAVRQWLADRFGSEYLVPLLYTTQNHKDIIPENMPDIPFIIKAAHGSGSNFICRDKRFIDWKRMRTICGRWLISNHYDSGREWQYKNIPPRIIVEKLLLTSEGKIPNDYKLHFFNGRLEFVYCSIDREGGNFRNMYSLDWKPLYFTWGGHDEKRGPEIAPPASFPKMLEIGSAIAKMFRYVRVDFYDVDGKLYYGEITLHHGSGWNHFTPESYDLFYGEKLDLNAPVQEDVIP